MSMGRLSWLACVVAVAAMLAAAISLAQPAPLLASETRSISADRPVDGDHDGLACMCEVLGACSGQMATDRGSSGGADWLSRSSASPVDERPVAGIEPEIPSPPPRVA